MQIYTKASLIQKLKEVKSMGWLPSVRAPGNHGAVGNTLEVLLDIKENNLPLPNAADWELKCRRIKGNSPITLFHMEPSPVALKFVSQILLPHFGWAHKEAGKKYPATEMSFRQTISCRIHSDRGFTVTVDREQQKVLVSFDKESVDDRHSEWLANVVAAARGELSPQPYWGFYDLFHKAGTKLHNCFFVEADNKVKDGKEFFKYEKIWMLSGFSLENFVRAIELGDLLVDFDARTGHNHGTKFRFRSARLPELYENIKEIE